LRTILQIVVFWFFRKFLSFLVIVVILVAAVFLQREIAAWSSLTTQLSKQDAAQRNVEHELQKAKTDASSRVAKLKGSTDTALRARITNIAIEIELKESELKKLGSLTGLLMEDSVGSGVATRFRLGLEIDLLNQEREHLKVLLSGIQGSTSLEKLRKKHVAVYKQLMQNEGERARLKANDPFLVLVFGTAPYNQLKQLEEAHKQLAQENLTASENYKRMESGLRTLKNTAQAFQFLESQFDDDFRKRQAEVKELKNTVQEHWISKLSQPVIKVVPTALLILLAIILTPVGIKAFFYFVMAPIASRRPAFSILPHASGIINTQIEESNAQVDQARFTSVSQRIALNPNEELLILPDYLQSTPVNTAIDTKWLLNWSLPISSLASGMVALSRIRCDAPCQVVISSTKDPFSEIGVLTLPNNSAIVFQPRSLVGVVYSKDKPLRMTKHWRLASMHAWLTLQFRYVVFHGPSKLIVKGCRGARIEEANTDRRINQAATMGFSANLSYSTTRCETFMSYLSGEQELFHDRFKGTPGVYVYEEMPHFGKNKGLTGRGIEGVVDTLLKAFGL
jgi:hypothetical protein